jgi:hypothetical protein
MTNKFIVYILSTIFITAVSQAELIKSGSLQAFSDGVNITLRWATENESNVLSFEILRSVNYNNGYVSIATINPKGPSIYEYIDYSAFRRTTTVYYYRIKVKFKDGESYFPALNEAPLTVDHNVSGVRRTWGSIKALFR